MLNGSAIDSSMLGGVSGGKRTRGTRGVIVHVQEGHMGLASWHCERVGNQPSLCKSPEIDGVRPYPLFGIAREWDEVRFPQRLGSRGH